MDDNKKKSLEEALARIEKSYGKGAIMNMDGTNKVKVDVIPTGCLALDQALGIGGVPRGRIIEIYGPESSGKTTLALHIAAEAQRAGGIVAFIDAEHALDPVYAGNLGVDLAHLYVSQPDDGEQALAIAEELARSGSLDLIVVDSVAALTPKAEIDGEMGDSVVGLQARLMSQAMRKLNPAIAKTNTCIIFINQLREKIGVMFGNPETTPGGLALKFYSSVRIDVRRIENLKKGDEIIGTRVRAKVTKNKVAPPYRQAEFTMLHGEGISREACLLDKGVESGILEKSGSWFLYGDEKLGQGAENARQYLKDNPQLAAEIEDKLYVKYLGHHYNGKAAEPAEADKPAEAKAEKKTAKK